jgi:hypothetical protein
MAMRQMRKAITAFSLAGLLLPLLSACNTTDALTPQVDVGGGMQPSQNFANQARRPYPAENRTTNRRYRATSPVTQADTDDIARSSQPETYRDRAYAQHPPVREGSPYPSGNSLEAQADALQSGSRISPASSGPPPSWSGQDDAAGTARSSAESPAGRSQSASHQPPPIQSAPRGAEPQQSAGNTIRFLPVIGAPVEAVTPLSRRLGSDARASGLVIRPSNDASAAEILKGYFSAFEGDGPKGRQVTIVYVWDVLDPAGNRLNRMQGQEVVPIRGAARENSPWASVPAATMELIAAKTISDYLNWRDSRRG